MIAEISVENRAWIDYFASGDALKLQPLGMIHGTLDLQLSQGVMYVAKALWREYSSDSRHPQHFAGLLVEPVERAFKLTEYTTNHDTRSIVSVGSPRA